MRHTLRETYENGRLTLAYFSGETFKTKVSVQTFSDTASIEEARKDLVRHFLDHPSDLDGVACEISPSIAVDGTRKRIYHLPRNPLRENPLSTLLHLGGDISALIAGVLTYFDERNSQDSQEA